MSLSKAALGLVVGMVVFFASVPFAFAQTEVIVGPTFTNTISGWPNSGLQFTAQQNVTLISFEVHNQSKADTVALRNSSGTILHTYSVPSGDPVHTATVNWDLTAGTTYRLTLDGGTSGDNGRWESYSSYPTANPHLSVEGVVDQGGTLRTSYWFTFKNLTTSGGNSPPTAANDTASVDEDTMTTIDVLANDNDPDGDPLSVSVTAAPSNGSTTVNADGTITYAPDADFNGSDSFIYEIDDGFYTASANVSITVNPVQDAPVAADDTTTTAEDTPVTIDVLANDNDVDGDTLTVGITAGPADGTATVNADKTITYTPDPNFYGTDTLTYQISDGTATDTAVVDITVTPVNDAPVANDDTASTDEDTIATVNVLTNDSDADGDTLTVSITVTPTNGTASVDASGAIVYTPDANYNGADSLTYQIDDGAATDTAVVSLTVDAVNDAPVAADDTATTDEDTAATIDVLANDTDIEGDNLSVTIASTPTQGSATVNADDTITYTPNPDFHGDDSFTYSVSDGSASATATVSVTVNPVADAPVAVDDSATTDEDTAVTIDVLANDQDPDGDTLIVGLTASPANGSASVGADGTITYTPAADFNGDDTLTYQVNDGTQTASATVTITVAPVNDAPVAADDSASTDEDTAVTIDVLTNDEDVDGDTLTVAVLDAPANGSASANADGTITYTPAEDYTGADSFTYEVSDPAGETAQAQVSVDVANTNDAPVFVDPTPAADSTIEADAGAAVEFSLAATDEDGDTVTYEVEPLADTATFDEASGEFSWTPTWEDAGEQELTLRATDGQATTERLVTLSVNILDEDGDSLPDDWEEARGLDPTSPDSDGDGISDTEEVGADLASPADTDADGTLDALDADSDEDGLSDADEAGDDDLATAPVDTDADGTADFRDIDSDDDSVDDDADNCVLVANPDQVDTDGDGTGDACTDDADGDGVLDADDNCPTVANAEQVDTDADGTGDACDDTPDGETDAEESTASADEGCGCRTVSRPAGSGQAALALLLLAGFGLALRRRRA